MNTKNTYLSNCLNVCKVELRKCITNSCLNLSCEQIESALHEPIDISKFKSWLNVNERNIKSKTNVQLYFDRAFLNELDKGTFALEDKHITCSNLVSELRSKGIKVLTNDTIFLELMWTMYMQLGVSQEEAIHLNHAIIGYMQEGQTFADYVSLVKRSNALKNISIDWDMLEKQYQEEVKKWGVMLDYLSLEVNAYEQ